MKNKLYLLMIVFSLFFISNAYGLRPRKNVLYLNSYQNGYKWSDNILDGVQHGFSGAEYNIDFYIEYMDSKKYFDSKIQKMLYEFYKYKFKNTKFDVIIVSDNNAFSFMLKFHDELFPGVPVVFCGVNDFTSQQIKNKKYITGVVENFDVRSNLELALSFHPNKKQVVVIGDRSTTGKAIRKQIEDVVPYFKNRLTFKFRDTNTLQEIIQEVKERAKDSIIYFIPLYKDANRQFYSAGEVLKSVWEASHAPIYSNWEFLLGEGIIGGKLLSGKHHGEVAAKIAIKILNGKKASDIPVVTRSTELYMFDYDVISRFYISTSELPRGSIVINEPYTFYEINRQVFWTIIIALIILLFTILLLVVNIVEKKSVEEKIKEQLSFLQILMDTIPVPIFFTDRKMHYKGCNMAFEQWFGVPRKEIIKNKYKIITGNGISRLNDQASRDLFKNPGIKIYESILKDKDSKNRNVILYKSTYKNAKDEVAGLVGVIHDITDIKKAEYKLRQAEEKYRSIFENSALGIFRSSPDGKIVDANPALARMMGYENINDFISADLSITHKLYGDYPSCLYSSGKNSISFEHRYIRLDGSTMIANLNVRMVYNDFEEVSHFEGFIEDISQRKKFERELKESQRMLTLVLDNIPQLVYWKDKDLNYIGANKSFTAFFDLQKSDDVWNKNDFELMPKHEDAVKSRQVDWEVVNSNKPLYKLKWTITNTAGEELWLQTNKVPLHDDNGQVVGILSTSEDITQNVILERQLVQSQKMEAIGTLAGGIAHDFNNILTSIINSTELALEDIEEIFIRTDLERVLKASQRGSRLVQQILTFSRPSQAGFQTTNLGDVVNEAIGLIRASLPRNIKIEEDIPSKLPVCHADPTQIHQIVMNLCTNSFQAMRDCGGKLKVSLVPQDIGEKQSKLLSVEPGSFLKLSIEDNGPGIAPEIMDKIFDPFFTTKGKGEGTGLGLAVVHGIIKNHGGTVNVHSSPMISTVFEILIPVIEADSEQVLDFQGLPLSGNERILFIEDDEDQLQTVPRVISQLGYKVHAVKGAKDALEYLKNSKKNIDLIITDYDMPETNGLDLAGLVSELEPQIPMIMVSGRKRAAKVAKSQDNIKQVIIKPYNRATISQAIRLVLDDSAGS